MRNSIEQVNIGLNRAVDIEIELFGGAADSLCGHVKGSQAYEMLREHAERFLDQSLLGRGFEKYDGKDLREQDIIKSRKTTASGLRNMGMGDAEAGETVREVEKKVTVALVKVLGKEIIP
jgi:hypothetical protein